MADMDLFRDPYLDFLIDQIRGMREDIAPAISMACPALIASNTTNATPDEGNRAKAGQVSIQEEAK